MDQICDWFASICRSVGHLYFSRPRYHKISCSVLLKKIAIIYPSGRENHKRQSSFGRAGYRKTVVLKTPLSRLFIQPYCHWIILLDIRKTRVMESLRLEKTLKIIKSNS